MLVISTNSSNVWQNAILTNTMNQSRPTPNSKWLIFWIMDQLNSRPTSKTHITFDLLAMFMVGPFLQPSSPIIMESYLHWHWEAWTSCTNGDTLWVCTTQSQIGMERVSCDLVKLYSFNGCRVVLKLCLNPCYRLSTLCHGPKDRNG